MGKTFTAEREKDFIRVVRNSDNTVVCFATIVKREICNISIIRKSDRTCNSTRLAICAELDLALIDYNAKHGKEEK